MLKSNEDMTSAPYQMQAIEKLSGYSTTQSSDLVLSRMIFTRSMFHTARCESDVNRYLEEIQSNRPNCCNRPEIGACWLICPLSTGLQPCLELAGKVGRRLDQREVSGDDQRPADPRIECGTVGTLHHVPLHSD